MGIADRLGGPKAESKPAPKSVSSNVQTPATPPSAPVKRREPAQAFSKTWWDGLGLSFAGDGTWGPEPKATLHVNGQKAKYRRAVADGDAPMEWIENEWAKWYPALDRARSRVEFHALWLCIRWTVVEAQRLAVA